MTYWSFNFTTGWVSGLLMLTLFLYAVKKHVSPFKYRGKMKNWFNYHVVMGLLTPIAVLFHTKFYVGSINGGVAFFSMCIVVASGIVGRFLLRRALRWGHGWMKLFMHWHVLHIPLIVLLGIAVLIHIIAVHAY